MKRLPRCLNSDCVNSAIPGSDFCGSHQLDGNTVVYARGPAPMTEGAEGRHEIDESGLESKRGGPKKKKK